MTFLGQEPGTTAAPEETPLRTFTYKTWAGRTKTVEAHYLQFMSEHVTFWLEQDGDYNFLVLAESNRDCQDIKETP